MYVSGELALIMYVSGELALIMYVSGELALIMYVVFTLRNPELLIMLCCGD